MNLWPIIYGTGVGAFLMEATHAIHEGKWSAALVLVLFAVFCAWRSVAE